MKLYHGSEFWFARPDPVFAEQGDGRSVLGIGFYATQDISVVQDHFKTRGIENAVIYEIDYPDTSGMLRTLAPLEKKWLNRFEKTAQEKGYTALASGIQSLKSRNIDTLFNDDLLDQLHACIPDQILEKDFLKAAGVDCTDNGIAFTFYSYEALGDMKLGEIVGYGAKNMPENARLGDSTLTHSRHIPNEHYKNGELYSETLSMARVSVERTGDLPLAQAFERLAKHLLTDAWIVPGNQREAPTREQAMGYDIRNGVGIAVNRALTVNGTLEAFDDVLSFIEKNLEGETSCIAQIKDIKHEVSLYIKKMEAAQKAVAENQSVEKFFNVYDPEKETPPAYMSALQAVIDTKNPAVAMEAKNLHKSVQLLGTGQVNPLGRNRENIETVRKDVQSSIGSAIALALKGDIAAFEKSIQLVKNIPDTNTSGILYSIEKLKNKIADFLARPAPHVKPGTKPGL